MLILVRHGRTPANAAGLLQGRLDQDLDDHGRRQAEAIASFVRSRWSVDEIVSSPLVRARQTAAAFGIEPEIDERWIELAYGEYEGTSVVSMPAGVWQRWRSDPEYVAPGGESFAALDVRVRAACESMVERLADRNVVVVSHVSPIKAAVSWALGVGEEIGWRMFLDLASITRISGRDGHASLVGFNDITHLIPD